MIDTLPTDDVSILDVPHVAGDVSTALLERIHVTAADKLVVSPKAPTGLAEQYRKLAATLHFGQGDRIFKIIMVVSAVPGEGKTLTSANVALTLSESYKRRVLLVDADLRRPSVHTIFRLPNVSGLGEYLRARVETPLSPIAISPQLSLVPAGAPTADPISGLTSGRMHRFLRENFDAFDWIIIDTPPVAILPDARLLASLADGALLVIGAGTTPYAMIQRAIVALGRERILGVVLNRVDTRTAAGGYSYDGYYGAYASQGTESRRGRRTAKA